jgi:carbamoyltransferase
MPVYVLGTHTSHECSACLLKDGAIAVAIEKERVTGEKHAGGNDNPAVQYCLNAEGIALEDVDLVVQNANFDMFERRNCITRMPNRIVENARRVVTISHHLAHMFSAVATSPFEDTAALVIDGCGNCFADCIDKDGAVIPERPPTQDLEQLYFEKDSYYEYRGGSWRTVYKDFSPYGPRQGYPMYPSSTMHSIGGAYGGVSNYVFRGMDDPGKLMGLAPYGRPGVFEDEMFSLRDGRVFLNYDWMKKFDRPATDYNGFKQNFQYYADIAWWAQRQIERALLYVIDSRYEMSASENLAYAGGVALNAVANRLIKTRTKFKNVYIQPAAGDNGLAIGCAFYGWLEVLGERRKRHNGSSHFGRHYSRDEIQESLAARQSRLQYRQDPDIVGTAADLLLNGKILGWFQGGSEFGPRALGHRSILALPADEQVRDFINSKIKFREDFRPFAPSVIAEDVSLYFDQDYDSPYMIMVAPVRPQWKAKIPAVVHRDGTARIQTVHREITPRYYELHRLVKEKTGISVLLNTSFNKRGMPIVETPRDAIALFLETAMDALIIEDWLVLKTEHTAVPDGQHDLRDLFEKVCAAAAADKDRPSTLGVIQIVVNGIQESWVLDFSGTPKASRGSVVSADQTVVMTRSALQKIVHNPGAVNQLFERGLVQIPGTGSHSSGKAAVLRKLVYLMNLLGD